MYAPKIKTKPREHRIGAFIKRILCKPFNWDSETEVENAKFYAYRRIEKIAKFKKYKISKFNKWLSRRMLRGAARITWKRKALVVRSLRPQQLAPTKQLACLVMNRPKNLAIKKLHFRYRNRSAWFHRWTFDKIKARRFNSRVFGKHLSVKLRKNIKVRALNIFSYFISKKLFSYKTHQHHLWNRGYRRFRFQYKNYFDIVNAFFVLSLMDNTENFLLSILKITLPLILKIRRFFKFLNAVINNMPELKEKYSVFKIAVAGKLAGGTKRTKAHCIGYGILPVQTLTINAVNKFLAYTHIYGEFGLKLLMCKDSTPKQLISWKSSML